MRKTLGVIVAACTLLDAVPVVASNTSRPIPPSSSARPARPVKGTVNSVNVDERSFALAVGGKEMTFYWDDATRMNGDPAEQQSVEVTYAMKNGKAMATAIKLLE